MQMQLKQQHIEAAIRDFVEKAGIQFPVDEISFTAGRGKDGLTATIDLEDPFASLLDAASEAEDKPAKAPAPKGTRTMEARGNENVMPPVKTDAPVDEDTPEPEAKEEDAPAKEAPPFSDEEEQDAKEQEAPASKKEKVSLFG